MKSKGFVLFAILLLALLAGCASQAGSSPSTVTPEAGAGVTGTPATTEELGGTPAVAVTETVTPAETVTSTGAITGTDAVTETGTVAPSETVTATVAPTPLPTLVMPALSEDVQGWPVLWDPEYGFEVRYPDDWVVSDLDVADEDAPVVRAYALTPANWEQEWNPIVVEISEGTQDAFRQHYKEPAATEERSIGPLTYSYETLGQQGSAEHLAVFQSRDNPDIRVVVRDAVTGFSDRAQAGANLQDTVEQVIQSFRWRQ